MLGGPDFFIKMVRYGAFQVSPNTLLQPKNQEFPG